ncbi:hypothetical protein F0562_029518 [Nyssa sinensis]|uniref:Uncharacterized protein n=1 Tax=Nyssa sinensis TaxID=561372 RepID=A0A5J5B3A3_9ASTE|nr:hypothetical protein F0562_029518 [Nyssa sinensis]
MYGPVAIGAAGEGSTLQRRSKEAVGPVRGGDTRPLEEDEEVAGHLRHRRGGRHGLRLPPPGASVARRPRPTSLPASLLRRWWVLMAGLVNNLQQWCTAYAASRRPECIILNSTTVTGALARASTQLPPTSDEEKEMEVKFMNASIHVSDPIDIEESESP